jgi:xanthine/CO dehydrogenase XdhC/CoxF family maturation factor
MNDTLHDVAAWADRGDRIAIAMVLGAVRSAARRLGTEMAIPTAVRSSAASRGASPRGAALDKCYSTSNDGSGRLSARAVPDADD